VLARLRRAARFRCPRTPRRARRSRARLLAAQSCRAPFSAGAAAPRGALAI